MAGSLFFFAFVILFKAPQKVMYFSKCHAKKSVGGSFVIHFMLIVLEKRTVPS